MEYSRRNFLKQNSIAGLGMIGAGTLAGTFVSTDVSANTSAASAEITKISDLNLKKLHYLYKLLEFYLKEYL